MLKILINAYACSPHTGSEPGMAWNWCVNLAKHCELHIITEGEFKAYIDEALPNLPQGKNMHFYYNPVSSKIREMCWNQGDWRFYKHYKAWQYKTYELAKELVEKENIDILHQLNMIGFREPGYLWKIKQIPLVWGPVDAKESFPVAYLQGAGFKTKMFIHLKNIITKIQLKTSYRVKQAVRQAKVVIAASSNSKITFKKYYKIDAPLINETGCYIQKHAWMDKTEKEMLDLLWVGKMDFRKQLGLAIQSLAAANNKKINLQIVGGGDPHLYQELAKQLGVENQCKWLGVVSHKVVQELMQKSDLFFFTSVAEGTPHVVLEAIANNLPVLCFNTCGQGDSVNEHVGRKIELSTPEQSVLGFAREINLLNNKRGILSDLSANCSQRQKELSWDVKANQLIELYRQIKLN